MATSNWHSHVFPHGPLTQLSDRLWYVKGKLKSGNMPRNMVVYRLNSGGLLIHSAVAMNDEGMRALEALGKPEIMIVPNTMHRLDAGVYKERYPDMLVVCPRAATLKVSEVVKVDGACEDVLPKHGVVAHTIAGVKPIELCYELALATGTALVFTDVLMNMHHVPGFDGWLFKLLGSVGYFGMTKIGKFYCLTDKEKYRAWLMERSKDPRTSVICVGHGDPITTDCQSMLKAAAERL